MLTPAASERRTATATPCLTGGRPRRFACPIAGAGSEAERSNALGGGGLGLRGMRGTLIEGALAIHLILIGDTLATADPLRPIRSYSEDGYWWPNIFWDGGYFCFDKMSHDVDNIETYPWSPGQFVVYSFVAPKGEDSNIRKSLLGASERSVCR
jgi:hypothetical protein